MGLTYDEQRLTAIYNDGGRESTLHILLEMRSHLEPDEMELRQLTDSAISKLQEMTDEAYAALDLIPMLI